MRNRILLGMALAAGTIGLTLVLLGTGAQPQEQEEVTLQQIHEDLLTIAQQLQHLENLGTIARELRFGLDVHCRCECDSEP